jgi:hypothetical protein
MSDINTHRKKRARIPHFNLKRRTQIFENKKSIEALLENAQEHCKRIVLEITNVTIMKWDNKNQNDKFQINCINEINDIEEIKKLRTKKALEAKDLANLSDKGYDKFLQCFKSEFEFPTLREIKTLRNDYKKLFEIQENEPKGKITFVIKSYLDNFGAVYQNKFIIKLSGDSINIAKTGIKLLNFTFTLIHEYEKPMSAEGNYILGIKIYLILNCNCFILPFPY